jgi:thymidine kinase
MSLTTIKGPMFAGKSQELIRLANRRRHAKRTGERILVYKWAEDRRHIESQTRATLLSSHDGHSTVEALPVSTILEIDEHLRGEVDCTAPVSIYVDEVQVFEHEAPGSLLPWVLRVRREFTAIGEFVLAGLDLYFDKRPWAWWGHVEGHALTRLNLTAICYDCHRDEAIYSHRISGGTGDIEPGGAEAYVALCWACDEIRARQVIH